MISGATIHAGTRRRTIERSCETFGGSTHAPRSPVEAAGEAVIATSLRLRHANSEH